MPPLTPRHLAQCSESDSEDSLLQLVGKSPSPETPRSKRIRECLSMIRRASRSRSRSPAGVDDAEALADSINIQQERENEKNRKEQLLSQRLASLREEMLRKKAGASCPSINFQYFELEACPCFDVAVGLALDLTQRCLQEVLVPDGLELQQYYFGICADPLVRWVGSHRYPGHRAKYAVMYLLMWNDGPQIGLIEVEVLKVHRGMPGCVNRGPGNERHCPEGTAAFLYMCVTGGIAPSNVTRRISIP